MTIDYRLNECSVSATGMPFDVEIPNRRCRDSERCPQTMLGFRIASSFRCRISEPGPSNVAFPKTHSSQTCSVPFLPFECSISENLSVSYPHLKTEIIPLSGGLKCSFSDTNSKRDFGGGVDFRHYCPNVRLKPVSI